MFGDAQGGIYADEMMGIALRDEDFVVVCDEGETVANEGDEVGETVIDVWDDDFKVMLDRWGEERSDAGPGAVRADEDVGRDRRPVGEMETVGRGQGLGREETLAATSIGNDAWRHPNDMSAALGSI
jgi:hypothetical protein